MRSTCMSERGRFEIKTRPTTKSVCEHPCPLLIERTKLYPQCCMNSRRILYHGAENRYLGGGCCICCCNIVFILSIDGEDRYDRKAVAQDDTQGAQLDLSGHTQPDQLSHCCMWGRSSAGLQAYLGIVLANSPLAVVGVRSKVVPSLVPHWEQRSCIGGQGWLRRCTPCHTLQSRQASVPKMHFSACWTDPATLC